MTRRDATALNRSRQATVTAATIDTATATNRDTDTDAEHTHWHTQTLANGSALRGLCLLLAGCTITLTHRQLYEWLAAPTMARLELLLP